MMPMTAELTVAICSLCLPSKALVECVEGYCPCGDRCANQRIQKGVMPGVMIQECGRKGLGLFSLQDIRAGEFVGEYMGEIVTENEYHMRRLVGDLWWL